MATTTKTVCKCTKFTTSISDLPPEVLAHIFTFSPLSTRKSLKCVCRRWYECATRKAVVENEKFAFQSAADLEKVTLLMENTNYPYLNFQFEDYSIIDLPRPVWEACSHRVNTLALMDCQWDDETMKDIMIHCDNLEVVAVETPKTMSEHEVGDVGAFFAILSSMNITRPKLQMFSLVTNFTLVRDTLLGSIMTVCPNVKHLNFAPKTRAGRTTSYPERESAALVSCLDSVTQLESFKFDLRTNGHWLETLTERANAGIRLKQFETVIEFEDRLEETLLAFFASQRDLRRIYMNIKYFNCDKKVKRMVFHILEACPKLKELHFEYHPGCLHLESSEVPRFVCLTSKLQFLTLGISDCGPAITPDAVIPSAGPRLSTLGLVRFAFSMDDEVAAELLPQYDSLQHLELSVSSDMVLQKIIQYLPKLQTLCLENVEGCTDFGFTGEDENRSDGFSINDLPDLYSLMIGPHSPGLTKKTLQHLNLPHLVEATFYMDAIWRLCPEELVDLADRLPSLSVISFDGFGPCEENFKLFCQSVKHLDYLYCSELLDKTELVSELLDLCPHPELRIFSGRLHSMVFNRATKSFQKSDTLPTNKGPRQIEERGFWRLR